MTVPAILASLTWVKSSGGVTFHQWDMEMGEFGPSLEDISEFTSQAALAFLEGENYRNLYINAKWVVRAVPDCPESAFLAGAKWALLDWKKHLNRCLNPGPVRRMLQKMSYRDRTLAAIGVLFLEGNLAHPKRIGGQMP